MHCDNAGCLLVVGLLTAPKLPGPPGALLIAPIAARRFDASEVGEVELNNGFERLGGRTASPTATSETRLRRSTFSQCINGPLVVRYLSVADIRPAERNARDRRDRTVGAGAECR